MKNFLLLMVFMFMAEGLYSQEKFTDSRDGVTYRTVTIAGMTWMAENLRFKVPDGASDSFDKNPHNAASYGILYDWKTAMKACPDGWHLPSGQEWRTLVNNLEADESWRNKGSGPGNFDIQLAGMQDHEGTFTEMDEGAYYWTSTEYNENEAEFFSYLILDDHPVIDISRKEDMPDIHGAEKANKYSVRCVRNR